MPGDSGYDEEFVDPPPEYLKCVVCYLVLQQPVQIATCGHRYCSTCYDRVKGFAKHLNAPFTCPVDRTEIDETKVFEDNGMARIVLDLKVKCSCHGQGCKWSGELRDLYAHKNQCPQVLKQLRCGLESEDNPLLMTRMNSRLDKYEESLSEKDREIALVKVALQQLQEKGERRDREIEVLKTKNEETMQEINSVKETNKELKEVLKATQRKLNTLESERKKNCLVTAGNPKAGQKRKIEDECYVNVKVLTEDALHKWSGQDLFDKGSVKPVEFEILKTENLRNATQIIGEFFGYAAGQCRLWFFRKRINGTHRPGRFDSERSDLVRINGDTELFVAAEHHSNIFVFLEISKGGLITLSKKKVMVFFKYYDPSSETMSYCCHAYIDQNSKPGDLFPVLCESAGLLEGTHLLFYEEVNVGVIQKICTDKSFDEAVDDLMDGDIICFQAHERDLKRFSKPTPIEYFRDMC